MSLFYTKKRGCTTHKICSFLQAFGMPLLDTPTRADEEEEISLSSHVVFLQENRGEISDTSDGPYLWLFYVTTGEHQQIMIDLN